MGFARKPNIHGDNRNTLGICYI